MLSDRQVASLKGVNKLVADGGGLYVRLSRHGTKSFVFRAKGKYVTLGEYPRLSLQGARKRVSELQGESLGDMTFKGAMEAYLKSCDYKHPKQVKERLERDIIPEFGDKRLIQVSSSDISAALQKIVDRGSNIQANRTLADVKHVFDFAYGKGWISHDPAIRITRRVVGGREKSREVVLTDEEIKDHIELMRADRFQLETRVASLLLLVTGQRSSEVLGVSKSEFDGRWWTIPKERTKNGKEQKVYVTHLALWLFKKVDFTFGSDHRVLSRAYSRAGLRYIPRDLRRTVATKMADLGVMPHVVEKCLNHTMEGVMAVYNKAEFLPEKKEAWNLWARHLLKVARAPFL